MKTINKIIIMIMATALIIGCKKEEPTPSSGGNNVTIANTVFEITLDGVAYTNDVLQTVQDNGIILFSVRVKNDSDLVQIGVPEDILAGSYQISSSSNINISHIPNNSPLYSSVATMGSFVVVENDQNLKKFSATFNGTFEQVITGITLNFSDGSINNVMY